MFSGLDDQCWANGLTESSQKPRLSGRPTIEASLETGWGEVMAP